MKGFRGVLAMLMGRRPPALQVGALCIDPSSGNILLVTSRGTGRWIIPKGWPMQGRSLARAAAIEAWEEAGVEGRIESDKIGRYTYLKQQDRGFSVPIEVMVHVLAVHRLADRFPECHERERAWFSLQEAAACVAEPGLARIILSCTDRPCRNPNAEKGNPEMRPTPDGPPG